VVKDHTGVPARFSTEAWTMPDAARMNSRPLPSGGNGFGEVFIPPVGGMLSVSANATSASMIVASVVATVSGATTQQLAR
jgi:hypothetical protein